MLRDSICMNITQFRSIYTTIFYDFYNVDKEKCPIFSRVFLKETTLK